MRKGVSAVIPAYNEEETVARVIKTVKQMLESYVPEWEIIVVNDGSTDRTPDIVSGYDTRLINLKRNRGYGYAVKQGIKAAEYDYIMIIDSDGTYPGKAAEELIKIKRDYDMLVGAREKLDTSLIKKPAKWCFNKLAGYITGEKIPDINSGLRIFKKSLAEEYFKILPDGFSLTSTLTIAMLTNDKDVRYIPIGYKKRKSSSNFHPLKDSFNMFSLIFRTVLFFNPLKVFIPVSFILFFVAMGLFLYRIFIEKAFMTTIIVLFLTSLQMLSIGLLADLIERKTR